MNTILHLSLIHILTKENTKDSNKNSQTKEDNNLNNKQTSNNTNNKTDNKINITTNNSNKNDSGTNNNNKNDNNTNNKVDNDNKHPNVDNEGNKEDKKEEEQEEINKDLANKHFTKYNSCLLYTSEFYLVIWEKETEKSKIELQKRANNWMNRLRNCELKSEILSKDDIISVSYTHLESYYYLYLLFFL